MSFLKRFWADESGATVIEYGLIAAGIFVAIMLVMNELSGTMETTYQGVSDAVTSASP
jgi:pilus assembly protein Flp/PilA